MFLFSLVLLHNKRASTRHGSWKLTHSFRHPYFNEIWWRVKEAGIRYVLSINVKETYRNNGGWPRERTCSKVLFLRRHPSLNSVGKDMRIHNEHIGMPRNSFIRIYIYNSKCCVWDDSHILKMSCWKMFLYMSCRLFKTHFYVWFTGDLLIVLRVK